MLFKKVEKFDFEQNVKLEFINSLKNNCTKYLLISDDSSEEICNLKAFVDIATTGSNRGLRTITLGTGFFIKVN